MSINIFSLINNIMLSRALYVAAEFDISDILSKQKMNLEELSQIISTDKKNLERLLNFLELFDVYKKDNQGNYFNTEFAQTMCSNHPNSIKSFLLHDDETRWNSIGNLGYSIKTGKASFDMLYGKSYFDYLKEHSVLSKRFDDAMTVISEREDELISQKLSFSGIVADIGGGKGQLLDKIINKNSKINGILFDLPEVINNIKNEELKFTLYPGSFFNEFSLKADIFILKRILHDWDDDKALQILINISNTMQDGSKLYIIDGILDLAKDKKLLAAVDLLLMTVFNGQERSLKNFTDLIEKANLEIVQITHIDDLVSAIECNKK